MVDIALDDLYFAGAAQTFAAIAFHIDIGAAQRVQQALVVAHLQRDAGLAQLHFKAVLLAWVQRAQCAEKMLRVQTVLGPVAAGLA